MGSEEPPQYTRYRARRRLLGGASRDADTAPRESMPGNGVAGRPPGGPRSTAAPDVGEIRSGGDGRGRSRRRVRGGGEAGGAGRRRNGSCSAVLALIAGWLLLSLVLFLISSHFERTPLPSERRRRARPGRQPADLGQQHPRARLRPAPEEQQGTGRRKDRLRALGHDHADPHRRRALGAPVDPARHGRRNPDGHGLQKINAAHAFGGRAESVRVIKNWLGIPINHVVEVNFENFPQLIDAMGGVDYTGGCIISKLDGGFANGGYTLRLPRRHATTSTASRRSRSRARARTSAQPNETDIQREEHQQALFNAHEVAAAVALELLPAAVDRLERAAGDHLRHERRDAARAVRGAGRLGHAADARAEADGRRARCPAARKG